jgi:hypothetical protein
VRACNRRLTDGTNFVSIALIGHYSANNFNLNPESGGGTGTVVTDTPGVGTDRKT